MSTSTNVMALFCEDIREEKNGIFTLVGLLPDNVNVSGQAGPGGKPPSSVAVLGKLCVFIRINFLPEEKPTEIKLELQSDEKAYDLGEIERKTIDEAAEKAINRGNALAGLISRAAFGGFNFKEAAGQLKVVVIIDGVEYLAAAMSLRYSEAPKVLEDNESS